MQSVYAMETDRTTQEGLVAEMETQRHETKTDKQRRADEPATSVPVTASQLAAL